VRRKEGGGGESGRYGSERETSRVRPLRQSFLLALSPHLPSSLPPFLPSSLSITVVPTPYGFSLGVGICYDIRFPELAMIMRAKGCALLLYPGAFNLTTGPAHWELLQRARAVDNQVRRKEEEGRTSCTLGTEKERSDLPPSCPPSLFPLQLFVAAVSPARNPASAYQAWGHSTIVNPWGEILATTGHDPALVMAELDMAAVEETRRNVPTAQQKRLDLYTTCSEVKTK